MAGNVVVSEKRTFEAASAYDDKKTAVLNFASACCPGGIEAGISLSQEECLCRESTLYSCISTQECMERFYEPHKKQDALPSPGFLPYMHNADLIYTPDVMVFKTYDRIPVLMYEQDWFNTDVITMAAPDLNYIRVEEETLLTVFEERFTRIMMAAAAHDVDVLILGAFGCGKFGNDPAVVAAGAARALQKYRCAFDTIEFAVYDGKKKKNYHMFRLMLDRYLNN